MKLYLSQILKEANAFGFGAPGQGGNSSATAFSNSAPVQTAPKPAATPQSGGMMLPSMPGPGLSSPINTAPVPFKPVI